MSKTQSKTQPNPDVPDWKKQYEQLLAERQQVEEQLQSKLRELSNAERTRDRMKGAAEFAESQIDKAKLLIEAQLQIKHKKGTQQNDDYFRGGYVEEDGVTEEVRFLRYLWSVLGKDIPF